MKHYFGVDIGGTHIKYGLVSEQGLVSHRGKIMTATTQAALIHDLLTLVNDFKRYNLSGVGISMPGIIKDSTVFTTGALVYLDIDSFIETMQREIDHPIHFVNDANAVALAEKWCGSAQDYSDFVCITLGTAVGGALFLNNALYEGAKGLAGEFGMSYTIGASQPSLLDSVAAKCGVVAGACREYSLKSDQPTRDFEVIIQRANDGETLAQDIVEMFCRNNAQLLYTLAVTLGPQALLIGGSVSDNATIMARIIELYQGIARDTKVFPEALLPEVVVCQHRANSGILGSVYHYQKENL